MNGRWNVLKKRYRNNSSVKIIWRKKICTEIWIDTILKVKLIASISAHVHVYYVLFVETNLMQKKLFTNNLLQGSELKTTSVGNNLMIGLTLPRIDRAANNWKTARND
mgnify:CR=1 FL=1